MIPDSRSYIDMLEKTENNFHISSTETELVYLENYPAVKSFVLKNSGTEDDAKDIYQEAFIIYWRNVRLGKFKPNFEGAAKAYLYEIAKNKWIDRLRKIKKDQVVYDMSFLNNFSEAEPIDDETNNYLNMVVQQFNIMKQPCKEVLYRFYYLKERLKTIAVHFNWTEGTAKNSKYRCLEKLRTEVIKNSIN